MAVNRKFKKDGEQSADFINCVAFGKQGEFVEKYLKQGMKIAVCGRIQTGSYMGRDGNKVYTTDVVVEEHEFVESKTQQKEQKPEIPSAENQPKYEDDFMDIPEGLEESLPFI